MLSYNWTHKEKALLVKEYLEKAGFDMIMDDVHIKGNVLRWMSDAINKSDVVLLLISRQYEDSDNAMSEAAFARNRNKRLIPLVVGWIRWRARCIRLDDRTLCEVRYFNSRNICKIHANCCGKRITRLLTSCFQFIYILSSNYFISPPSPIL